MKWLALIPSNKNEDPRPPLVIAKKKRTFEENQQQQSDQEQYKRGGVFFDERYLLSNRAVLRGRDFFSRKGPPLKDRARLRIFTNFPCAGRIAELGITGQNFLARTRAGLLFPTFGLGMGFFSVKDRPAFEW